MKRILKHIFFMIIFFCTPRALAVENIETDTSTATFRHEDIINEIITVKRPRVTRIEEKPVTSLSVKKKETFIPEKTTHHSLRFAFGISRDVFLQKWFPMTAFRYQYHWNDYVFSGAIESPFQERKQTLKKNSLSYLYENLVFNPQRKFSFFKPVIFSFGLPLGVNALSIHFRDLNTWKFIPFWGFQSQIAYQFKQWDFFVETQHFRFFKKYQVFLDNQLQLEARPTWFFAMGISQNW